MRISDWSSDVCSSDLDYLRSVGVASVRPERATLGESNLWRTRQESTPDLLIAAANEDHVRFQIEADMPPIQIYGTTGKSWQASVIRHVPLQGPCSLCLFPDSGPVALTDYATGKVVSPVSGQRLAADGSEGGRVGTEGVST